MTHIGIYIVKTDEQGAETGWVSERCPACNGGGKVGGSRSPVMTCPICKGTRVVFSEVPLKEAQAWIESQRKKAEDENWDIAPMEGGHDG